MNDLKDNFLFFQNIYQSIIDYNNCDELSTLLSNILNFMGDLKKLKILVNIKFRPFNEFIVVQNDNEKDANEALRFFNYALVHNPRNNRIYSNMGCK